MYTNINELYKIITDLDKSKSVLKNFYMLPGFNITETNSANSTSDCDTLNNKVIDDTLFMKFLGFFNNTKNNQTQKTKPKLKLSKKQEKTFTRKQKENKKENKNSK